MGQHLVHLIHIFRNKYSQFFKKKKIFVQNANIKWNKFCFKMFKSSYEIYIYTCWTLTQTQWSLIRTKKHSCSLVYIVNFKLLYNIFLRVNNFISLFFFNTNFISLWSCFSSSWINTSTGLNRSFGPTGIRTAALPHVSHRT